MKQFLRDHLDDLMISLGAGLIIFATAALSWVAALYVAGGFLIAAGVLIGLGARATTRVVPTAGPAGGDKR
jgi:hypothetical protein